LLARKGGLPDDVIEALRKGERPARMTAEEAALFEFCAEMLRKRRVADATYEKAVATFGEEGTMEIVGICGYYSLVSMVLNVAQVPLPEGEPLPFPEPAAGG
jgi:4-carboxymuconolactone decarboxylase